MRPNYDVLDQYIGTGLLSTYSFDFKITNKAHLQVIALNAAGVQQWEARGEDVTNVTSIVFDERDGGGTVTLAVALPSNWLLGIFLADDAPTQPSQYRNRSEFNLRNIEETFDYLSGQIQRLRYLMGRTLSFDNFTKDLLPTGKVPVPPDAIASLMGWDGTKWVYYSLDAITGAGTGLPPGGDTDAVLTKLSAADNDADWIQYAYSGFSARFNALFDSTSLADTLAKILDLQYAAPLVSLGASGNGLREKGDTVTSTTLTASVTKRSDPIDTVRFYIGASLLDTQIVGGAIPAGGSSTYNWTGSFSDNTTFSVQVDDDGTSGGPTTVTASTTFSYVYPYYVGAGAVGITAAAVAALTKRIIASTTSRVETITAGAGEVFYFAYPASYGALTSILDVNNFETLPDWTLRTENITGLDANAVSYRIYEFNNPVTAGAYQYTFKR